MGRTRKDARTPSSDEGYVSAGELVQTIIERRIDELTRLIWKAHPGNAYLRSVHPGSGKPADATASSYEDTMRPVRRKLRLLWLVEALCEYVIPALVSNYPSVTRKDFVALLGATWPASRGTRAKRMFDPELVRAAHAALLHEHPHWSSRAATDTLADRLMVTPRTIQAHLRIARKNQ